MYILGTSTLELQFHSAWLVAAPKVHATTDPTATYEASKFYVLPHNLLSQDQLHKICLNLPCKYLKTFLPGIAKHDMMLDST